MTSLKRTVASLQGWWTRLFLLGIVLTVVLDVPFWIDLPALAVLLALSLVRAPRRDDHPPVAVACPLTGRWAALNSPADTEPSHGIRAYGQAFAIDIAHPRPADFSTRIGWGLRQRRPHEFSSFGQPVYAVAPGTVVAVASGQRDHLARNTWPGLLYLMTVEGFCREVGGARFVVGNHVVIDHGEGGDPRRTSGRRPGLRWGGRRGEVTQPVASPTAGRTCIWASSAAFLPWCQPSAMMSPAGERMTAPTCGFAPRGP